MANSNGKMQHRFSDITCIMWKTPGGHFIQHWMSRIGTVWRCLFNVGHDLPLENQNIFNIGHDLSLEIPTYLEPYFMLDMTLRMVTLLVGFPWKYRSRSDFSISSWSISPCIAEGMLNYFTLKATFVMWWQIMLKNIYYQTNLKTYFKIWRTKLSNM